jgi:hypothetical protein
VIAREIHRPLQFVETVHHVAHRFSDSAEDVIVLSAGTVAGECGFGLSGHIKADRAAERECGKAKFVDGFAVSFLVHWFVLKKGS